MKINSLLFLPTSSTNLPARKPRLTARALYRSTRRRPTGKEQDSETGLHYYGARYLDSRTGRWLSGDPALGEYVPQAGGESDNLPGMGGVYNTVNLHLYHYAGNNPVKYVDPDGDAINLAAAGVGALIGAGVGATFAIAGGGSARDVVAAAAGGAVTGAMGGLTMGASLAVGMAGAGLASMGGYATQQLVAGEAATVEGYALSGASGVAGHAAGQMLGKGITAISNRISASQTTTQTSVTTTNRQAANSPDFIVDRSGQAFPVPDGATGPNPVINNAGRTTGISYTGGSGGNNGQVATMRVMNPRNAIGNAPDYPNGYVTYSNTSGQAVNPYSGQTVSKTKAHYPIGD